MIKNKIDDYQKKFFGNRLETMSQQIKEETSINGAQLNALKRFFNDLEDTAAKHKVKTDNKLKQNLDHDNRVMNERNMRRSIREQDDIFNTGLKEDKQQREKQWRKSVYVDHGIEGEYGYPSIKIPTQEEKLILKKKSQLAMKNQLNS